MKKWLFFILQPSASHTPLNKHVCSEEAPWLGFWQYQSYGTKVEPRDMPDEMESVNCK